MTAQLFNDAPTIAVALQDCFLSALDRRRRENFN
jgi:hypothetical protein